MMGHVIRVHPTHNRFLIMLRLFALFTIIPTLELYLLFQLGAQIGAGTTIWLVIVTGFIGASMAKREGQAVLTQLQADAAQGIPPADHLIEGLMVFAGGLLLVTPGVMTDFVGFSLILPFTRKLLAPWFRSWAMKRFTSGTVFGANFQFGNFRRPDGSFRHPDYPDVEIIDAPSQPKKGKDGPSFEHPQF